MILSRRSATPVVLALLVGACGDGGPSGGVDAGEDESPVVATTTIWADITSEMMCGQVVPAIVPGGADPHTFEPSLRDRAMIDDARVIIANGAGLEGGLDDLVRSSDATVVDLSEREIDLIDGDPHIWQDPRRVARAIDRIESGVAAFGGGACTDEYRERLDRLDRDIIRLLDPIPDASRVMVTSHDSLAYFAERYDLEIVGTVIPSTNTLAQTNAADLAALAEVIDARGIRAIFTEQLESSTDADALAGRLGVRVVPLVTDALTDDPATDTYLEMMLSNATSIAEALAP